MTSKSKVGEKYPIVTKENFKKVSAQPIKPPKNDKEFREATKNLYGIELSVSCFAYPVCAFGENHKYACNYKINESQDDYSKGEIYQLWDKKFSQYNGLKVLLDATFGKLSCGGVAGSHYGQTRCDKKTWDRVRKWDSNNDRKNFQNSVEQHNSLVEIFGFNPF